MIYTVECSVSLLLNGMIYIYIYIPFDIKFNVFLSISCLYKLSIVKSEVLLSPFGSVSMCLIYLNALMMLGEYLY